MLSPHLFEFYIENIIRNIKDRPGIGMEGVRLNKFKFADHNILIAGTEEELQDLVTTGKKESRNMGLSLNIKKTEAMVISKKKDPPTCDIKLNNKASKKV